MARRQAIPLGPGQVRTDAGRRRCDDAWLPRGSSADTLLGNAGNDTLDGGLGRLARRRRWQRQLVGGSSEDSCRRSRPDISSGIGNDLMIGGFGNDQLVGNAADDILIGGYTDHDGNAVALRAILNVWSGSGSYQDRINALKASSFAYRLLADPVGGLAATVHDDQAVDSLTGSAGADWFFANGWQCNQGHDPADWESGNGDNLIQALHAIDTRRAVA